MRKHNQHFKLLLFKINLLFGTSGLMSLHGKLKLLLKNSIYLIFSSLEILRRLIQTKLYHEFFLLCLKRNVSLTFRSSSCQKLISSVYVIGTACFDEFFLFHVIIGRHHSYPEGFCNQYDVAFFETSVLKEVRILCSLSPQYHYQRQCC